MPFVAGPQPIAPIVPAVLPKGAKPSTALMKPAAAGVAGAPGGSQAPGTAVVLVPSAQLVRQKIALVAPTQLQGYYSDPQVLGGFSLKGIVNSVKKAATDVGHAVGTAATSKIGQAALGIGLAATGVGLLPAAAIGAAVKGGGNLIKPGGNLAHLATGVAQGAALGAGSSLVGSAGRAIIQKVTAPSAADTAAASAALNKQATANANANQAIVDETGQILMPGGAQPGTPGIDSITGQPIPDSSSTGLPGVAPSITAAGGQPALLPTGTLTRTKTGDALWPAVSTSKPTPLSRQKLPTSGSSVSSSLDTAETTLAVGKQAKAAADKTAGQITSLQKKIKQLQDAATAAQNAGDASGASSFAALAGQLAQQLGGAASAAGQAAQAVNQAGYIAQGATQGAVAGGAEASISEFFSEHKLAITLVSIGIGAAVILPRILPPMRVTSRAA